MPVSLALIIPAALRETANKVGEALGQGPDNYTVPLSSDGENVTHYGLMHQAAGEDFLNMLRAAKQGTMPSDVDWAAYELTEAQVAAVVTALIMSASPDPDFTPPAEDPEATPPVYDHPSAHFMAVLDANGLIQM
jgi:hypothetical protein